MKPHDDARSQRFIRCLQAETAYCLNMSWVRHMQRGVKLQGQGNRYGVVGWTTYESANIPVYDLGVQLRQVQQGSKRYGDILILNTPVEPVALLVDRVANTIQPVADELFPLPQVVRHTAGRFFAGVVQHGDSMMLALSPDGFVPGVAAQSDGWRCTAPEVVPNLAGRILQTGRKLVAFRTTTYRHDGKQLLFGLSLSQVLHILRPVSILPVPGTSPDVLGLISWRGYPLAVIDLWRRLGGAPMPLAPPRRLLIARATARPAVIALAAQSQVNLYTLPLAHQVSTQPAPLSPALLRGQFDLSQATVVIPNLDRLIISNGG